MILTEAQSRFLNDEFGLSSDDLPLYTADELRSLREKCIDIEVEEIMKDDGSDADASDRYNRAVEVVNALLCRLRELRTFAEPVA